MNKTAGLMLAALLMGPLASLGADQSSPTAARADKLLLNEDFSGASLPSKWQPGGRDWANLFEPRMC